MASARLQITPTQTVYLLSYTLIVVLGFLIAQFGGATGFAIGTSISSTGVVGWAIFLYVRVSDQERRRIEVLRDVGLEEVYLSRSSGIRHELEPRLDRARKNIDFIGFGFRALREDLQDHFESWAKSAQVRILLLDPDFPTPGATYAAQRDAEESNSPGSTAADVRLFLSSTESLRASYPGNFQVRLYRCLPMVNIARMDDEIFWGPYLIGIQSRNTPTFRVSGKGSMFKVLASHFDKIWQDPNLSVPAP